MQVVEESVADDDMVMIRGSSNTAAVSVLLRGANDYMLDEMDRSLHDAFCVVKRVLESGKVVPGAQSLCISALQPVCREEAAANFMRMEQSLLAWPIQLEGTTLAQAAELWRLR